jgi:hypothetical protein
MIAQVTSALAGIRRRRSPARGDSLALPSSPVGFLRLCVSSSALLSAFAAMPSSSETRVRLAWAALSLVAAVWYLTMAARGESRKPLAVLAAAAAVLVPILTAGSGATSPEWVAVLSSLSSASSWERWR